MKFQKHNETYRIDPVQINEDNPGKLYAEAVTRPGHLPMVHITVTDSNGKSTVKIPARDFDKLAFAWIESRGDEVGYSMVKGEFDYTNA